MTLDVIREIFRDELRNALREEVLPKLSVAATPPALAIQLKAPGVLGECFTVRQVAEQLQRNVKTVQGWIRKGLLAAKKVGHGYLVKASDLKNFLDGGGANIASAPDADDEAERILSRLNKRK